MFNIKKKIRAPISIFHFESASLMIDGLFAMLNGKQKGSVLNSIKNEKEFVLKLFSTYFPDHAKW